MLLKVEEDEGGVKVYTPLLESEDGKKLRAVLENKANDDRKRLGLGKGAKKK